MKVVGEFLRDADISCVNLENTLSENSRHTGAFCSSPEFARIVKENKINIVYIANNHSFNAGERGLIEIINILKENNIKYFGWGMDIKEARNGEIVKIEELKIGFLGYTALCNSFFISLVKKINSGILPLYETIVLEDIEALKGECDFLIVAPNFDTENTSKIYIKI